MNYALFWKDLQVLFKKTTKINQNKYLKKKFQ